MLVILIILFIISMSSLWSIILVDEFTIYRNFLDYLGIGYKRKWKSQLKIIEYPVRFVHKLLNCSLCFGSWLSGFVLLYIFGTGWVFILIPITYFMTFYIKKSMTTSI